jgi:cell division septal protein FtsQ
MTNFKNHDGDVVLGRATLRTVEVTGQRHTAWRRDKQQGGIDDRQRTWQVRDGIVHDKINGDLMA